MMPSMARRVEAVKWARQSFDVKVGHALDVIYPPKFKVPTAADFVRMVQRTRLGLSTLPQGRSVKFVVTPDVLKAAGK